MFIRILLATPLLILYANFQNLVRVEYISTEQNCKDRLVSGAILIMYLRSQAFETLFIKSIVLVIEI